MGAREVLLRRAAACSAVSISKLAVREARQTGHEKFFQLCSHDVRQFSRHAVWKVCPHPVLTDGFSASTRHGSVQTGQTSSPQASASFRSSLVACCRTGFGRLARGPIDFRGVRRLSIGGRIGPTPSQTRDAGVAR